MKRAGRFLKGIYNYKGKYINGGKGVISLFMALLMMPFLSIAGILINSARVNSAIAIFDEALSNASDSTLGTYESFLRERFGLLAISQDISGKFNADGSVYGVEDFIQETYMKFMEENLKALNKPDANNVYTTSTIQARGVYSLADPNIMLSEIKEFGKYSVPAQTVLDTLSVEDLVSEIGKSLLGEGTLKIFSAVTNGTALADAYIDLGEAFQGLIDAVTEEQTAKAEYDTAYQEFAGMVDNYRGTFEGWVSEMASLAQAIADAKSTYEDEADAVEEAEDEEEQKAAEAAAAGKSYTPASVDTSARDNAKAAWDAAVSKFNTTNAEYVADLGTLKTEVELKQAAYLTKIDVLIEKVTATKGALDGALEARESIFEKTGDMVESVTHAVDTFDEKDAKKQKEDFKKAMDAETDATKKAEYKEKIDNIDKQLTQMKDYSTVMDATKDIVQDTVSDAVTELEVYSNGIYSSAVEDLRTIKANVAGYSVPQLGEDYLSSVNTMSVSDNKDAYYAELLELLTKAVVEQLEKDIVDKLSSDSIWAVIEGTIAFFKALFEVQIFADPELTAQINTTYYADTYGGLPSTKDRTVYPLYEGEEEDKTISDTYKQLFGDTTAVDSEKEWSKNILKTIGDIFGGFVTLQTDILKITNPVGLVLNILNIGNIIKEIMTTVEKIATAIRDFVGYMCDFVASAATAVGNKIIVSGYMSYMTSNRTSVGDSSPLNGADYNMRKQVPQVAGISVPVLSDLQALFNAMKGAASGGTDLCFYGAETEYLLIGSTSEYVNQLGAFGEVYLTRLLMNLAPVLTNQEVMEIASATGPFAPLVYIAFVVLEPFVDTILLVNGGDIPFWKLKLYLTPSGIPDLVTSVVDIGIAEAKAKEWQQQYKDKLGDSYTEPPEAPESSGLVKKFGETVNTVTYQQMLFLLMLVFYSQDTLVSRFSDIVEMEAIEYEKNTVVGADGIFDLDYSYTFIRAEGVFTMNEFIPLSDSDIGLSHAKRRIVYRGY